MNIKLFALCNQGEQSADSGKKAIFNCIKNFFPDCEGFYQFTSQKRMLLSVSQSLRAADIVIIAVQNSMYNATKKLLFGALDMKTVANEFVASNLSQMLNSGQIKQTTFNNNVAFPAGVTVLPTKNFINCGFVLSSGGQHIIYVPVDDPKAQEVVFGGLYDFLSEISERPAIQNKAISKRHVEIIARTGKKLMSQNIKVAVASHNGVDVIAASTPKNIQPCFVIDNRFSAMTGGNPRDYIIDIARQVRDNCHVQLGAAISMPIYEPDGSFFEYIAIADANGTRATKVYGEPGETESDLNEISVDKLMLQLYEYNDLGLEEASSENFNINEQKKDEELKNTMGLGVAAAGLVASIAGLVVALLMK